MGATLPGQGIYCWGEDHPQACGWQSLKDDRTGAQCIMEEGQTLLPGADGWGMLVWGASLWVIYWWSVSEAGRVTQS